MSLDHALSSIRTIAGEIINWMKLVCTILLVIACLATLASFLGIRIPYLPNLRASQEVGIVLAGIAYALSR